VATGAYLAAAYLAADAVRIGDGGLARAFRARALVAGVIAGGLAIGGLVVLGSDAHRLCHQLVSGRALPALIVSVAAGVTAVGLVWVRRYEPARYTAAVAAAAIVAGWALAQAPTVLPGLTVANAAAPHDTLVLIIVAVLAGGAVLFPSLALLFGLVLHGRFDPTAAPAPTDVHPTTAALAAARPGLAARAALACLVAGLGLLNIADARWAHAIGVASLFAFVGFGFAAVRPAELAGGPNG
jgi:cytochrome d ubiquinol oxidase subunit II